ncbi:hypothetical protein FDZ71_06265 [bacterium]|nr:MAG: hypothetical protein FDZ71_06265 [bacterium]
MRKDKIAFAAIAILAAIAAFAGINPLDPGLPQGWTTTATRYTTAFVVGSATVTADRLTTANSFASAMCVECHTRNPSALILNPTDGAGAYDVTNGVNDRGSHTVADAAGSSNSGGGWTNAAAGTRNAGQYEEIVTWDTANQAGFGFSKYGVQAPTQNRNSVTGAPGDMICESCHNVLVNRGPRLLLGAYGDSAAEAAVNGESGTILDADRMCLNCHGGATNNYAGFHGNGNLRPFYQNATTSPRKRHHVLAGDLLDLTRYNPDANKETNDSVMWAPSYTRELSAGLVGATDPFAFGKGQSATGQGARAAATALGDVNTGTGLSCVSCHRPHNARTPAGAFILREGDGTGYPNYNVGAGLTTGLMRQQDKDATYANKVYGEYQGLCNTCHIGY